MKFLTEIHSIRHPAFLELRSCRTIKGQQNLNSYLVEEELINDVVTAGSVIKQIFVSDESWFRLSILPYIEKALPSEIYKINQGLMRKIFSQGRAPKVVAICESKVLSLASFTNKKNIIILEGVQDCGNLGTILRTCEAFAIDGVIIISNDLTHLFNRVTIRSSVGSLFRLDICQTDIQSLFYFLKKSPFEVIATSPHAQEHVESFVFPSGPTAVVFGNETCGITQEIEKLANKLIAIKMYGKMESLNVAVSCGIVLHAWMNQKGAVG